MTNWTLAIMEPEDYVLSDVHVCADIKKLPIVSAANHQYELAETRFEIKLPTTDDEQSCASSDKDEDGDLVVERQYLTEVIILKHAMSTKLEHVGLQVWSGALLMCDYVIHKHELFRDATAVVELGSGTGLVSLLVARYAQRVFCTDTGEEVLRLCKENIENNASFMSHDDAVKVRSLDWTENDLPGDSKEYGWTSLERTELEQLQILLAAEVIYDVDLTEAFFKTIHRIMSRGSDKVLYITLEKRLNFTLCDLEVSCPAYDHYLDCLQHLCSLGQEGNVTFTTEQIPCDFPQHMTYDRHKNLELWRIASKR